MKNHCEEGAIFFVRNSKINYSVVALALRGMCNNGECVMPTFAQR